MVPPRLQSRRRYRYVTLPSTLGTLTGGRDDAASGYTKFLASDIFQWLLQNNRDRANMVENALIAGKARYDPRYPKMIWFGNLGGGLPFDLTARWKTPTEAWATGFNVVAGATKAALGSLEGIATGDPGKFVKGLKDVGQFTANAANNGAPSLSMADLKDTATGLKSVYDEYKKPVEKPKPVEGKGLLTGSKSRYGGVRNREYKPPPFIGGDAGDYMRNPPPNKKTIKPGRSVAPTKLTEAEKAKSRQMTAMYEEYYRTHPGAELSRGD